MGMFDWVHIKDERFVCSEGHDVCGNEFQTKDFDCVLGYVTITDGVVGFQSGCVGLPPCDVEFTGTFEAYADCKQCPAFVQYGTGNMCGVSVCFDVDVKDGQVTAVRRTSESTAEFLEREPARDYMANCEGPMPYEQAMQRHIHYPREITKAWQEKMRAEYAIAAKKRKESGHAQ
jgi:hypothetical protein